MPSKKSLAKQEKQQSRSEKKTKEKRNKIIGSIEIPDSNSKEVLESLRKMKAITPNQVASQFNLKVSSAKKLLNDLEKNGIIKMVARSSNLKVYTLN
jgi:small subunit ribosomal protein S25e